MSDYDIDQLMKETTGGMIGETALRWWNLLAEEQHKIQNPLLSHAALSYLLAISAKVLIEHGVEVQMIHKIEDFGTMIGKEAAEGAKAGG